MRNIYFFDFDDTLFDHSEKRISPGVKEALLYLRRDHGNIIAIASGRGRESEQFIRTALGLEPDYLILMNGQLVLAGEELVYENFAEASMMNEIMNFAKACGYAYGGYYSNGILVNELNRRVVEVWQEFGVRPPDLIPGFQKEIPLYQGHLYITREEGELFQDYLGHYVINWSHQYLMNLIPKSAGKSQAVRWCLKSLEIDREQAYAFGDGFNDCDMLAAVGHGVAMGNASGELKAVAEYVTASVAEDGVVRALQHYGKLNAK